MMEKRTKSSTKKVYLSKIKSFIEWLKTNGNGNLIDDNEENYETKISPPFPITKTNTHKHVILTIIYIIKQVNST